MFGGPVDPPAKPKPRPRPDPQFQDILNASVHPGCFAHYGREPNTNYKSRLLHYKQRSVSLEKESIAKESKRIANENYMLKFQRLTDGKRFREEVKSRVNRKLEEYEEELEKKRERLRDLLANDERQYYAETVDNLQKGVDLKYEAMKERVKQIDAEREATRLKTVEEKRIQQYADRCEDLRPSLAKRHLLESKIIQQQQMRENEARREAEKEWDRMWEDAQARDIQAQMEREEQECINEYKKQQADKEFLALQIRGKELAKIEATRTMLEDRIEMQKLAEEVRREEMGGLTEKRKKKIKMAEELRAQIKFQEKVIADRVLEEKKLEEAFMYLSQLEYEKEKTKIENTSGAARIEMLHYRQNLMELEKERLEDERKFNVLLEEHRKAVEEQQDEARCKVLEAKEKMMKDVLAGRAEQLAHKRQEAEQQLRQKQAENELCRLNFETNRRLTEESERQRIIAAQEYRDDLCRQIDYNNTLRERERLELERQLELGRQQEEKYKQKVANILATEFELGEKHPFRRVLERYDCHCPKMNPKY